jgi:dTDP-4-amino-4,6-dideoxygalactose transaminase
MPVLLPKGTSREQFMGFMKEQGIQTSFHYPPIHTFTAYQSDTMWNLPVTEEVASREVTLPLYPALTEQDILLVTNAISQALR